MKWYVKAIIGIGLMGVCTTAFICGMIYEAFTEYNRQEEVRQLFCDAKLEAKHTEILRLIQDMDYIADVLYERTEE